MMTDKQRHRMFHRMFCKLCENVLSSWSKPNAFIFCGSQYQQGLSLLEGEDLARKEEAAIAARDKAQAELQTSLRGER